MNKYFVQGIKFDESKKRNVRFAANFKANSMKEAQKIAERMLGGFGRIVELVEVL